MQARSGFLLWVILLTFSFFSLQVSAQTPDTAVVRGSVVDQSHALVAGADITITSQRTGLKRTVQTDASGKFSVSGLPIGGEYEISAQKQGFALATSNVTVIGGATAEMDFQLSPAQDKTEITVTGAVGEVRTDLPQIGDRLGTQQIEETPLLNRRITYLPMLNAANRPAINQGDVFMNQNLFTTNGTGRRQAWFEVDGGNSVDLWGRQTIFTNLPLDAVDEMNVLTSPFSAEYDQVRAVPSTSSPAAEVITITGASSATSGQPQPRLICGALPRETPPVVIS